MPIATTSGPIVIGHRGPMRCASAPARAESSSMHDGDRQQRRAGLQRRVAEVGLQVHDQQEGDGARWPRTPRTSPRSRPRTALTGTRPAAPSGSRSAPRRGGTRPSASSADDPEPPTVTTVQPLPGPSISAYTTPARPSGEQHAADHVEVRAGVLVARLGDVAQGDEDRDGGDRQVDDEHPAPRHRVDEVARRGTGRSRSRSRRGPTTPPMARPRSAVVERRRHHRQAVRDEQRGGDALEAARRDQRAGVGRDRAQQRRRRERRPARSRRSCGGRTGRRATRRARAASRA